VTPIAVQPTVQPPDAATGMAETEFHQAYATIGRVVTTSVPEVAEFVGDKIKELRDYHRLTS